MPNLWPCQSIKGPLESFNKREREKKVLLCYQMTLSWTHISSVVLPLAADIIWSTWCLCVGWALAEKDFRCGRNGGKRVFNLRVLDSTDLDLIQCDRWGIVQWNQWWSESSAVGHHTVTVARGVCHAMPSIYYSLPLSLSEKEQQEGSNIQACDPSKRTLMYHTYGCFLWFLMCVCGCVCVGYMCVVRWSVL